MSKFNLSVFGVGLRAFALNGNLRSEKVTALLELAIYMCVLGVYVTGQI